MKKIFRILIALTLSLTFMTITSYAEEITEETTVSSALETESVTYTLSLSDAINMALKDNPQLKMLDIAKTSNIINLDAAKKTKSLYKEYPVTTSAYEVMYVKKGYYVSMYEMLIRLNAKETVQAEARIKYNTLESYYNYKLALALMETTEDAYTLAKENLDNVAKRYELGMISAIDYENAKLSVETVGNTVDTYKRNAEIAKENLMINLNIEDKNCELILTDGIAYEDFQTDFDVDLEKAMTNRYDVSALYENYELAKLYFKYTEVLSASSANYQTAYSDLISKEYSYTNNKKLIALSVKSSYFNILNNAQSLETSEKSAEIAKKKYEINKVKFDSGMITNSELTQSLNDYLYENINLENAKLKYKMSVEKYKAEIEIGL